MSAVASTESSMTDTHADHTPHRTSTGASNIKVAMWAFLGSEVLLFGALISTYLLYRGRSVFGPRPVDLFDIPYTSVSAFVLLLSSFTMVLAVDGAKSGNLKKMRIWLVTTALLGALFVGGQVYEFTGFIREHMTLKTNVASSAFYLLTGFHGVHVTLGVVMLLALVLFSLIGRVGTEHAEVVEITGLYWHFVDIVWIVLFTLVYLIPAPK